MNSLASLMRLPKGMPDVKQFKGLMGPILVMLILA